MKTQIIVLDFGSQYTQLIGRKVRELGVYSEIWPYTRYEEAMSSAKAIILSGSPFSCLSPDALQVDISKILDHCPVLAICYGAQLAAHQYGGRVESSEMREYGKANLAKLSNDIIFREIDDNSQVWMSHADSIITLPDSFELLAGGKDVPIAAYKYKSPRGNMLYGVQFHPEVSHSLQGKSVLRNFLYKIAGLDQDWSPASFVEESIKMINARVHQDEHVMMALSGGVDSTVAASLIHHAIGDRLHCVFVDNGLLRKNEYEGVLQLYQRIGLNVHGVDAKQLFWDELAGVSDPEKKRKIIGRLFIEIFEEEAQKDLRIKWLGQGTIYPDVIESVSVHGPSVTIKSHHNVGGLPEKLNLKLIEPLRSLFKDEVRKIGAEINLPADILNRHPFPGPGLAIRIIGDITQEKVAMLQEADYIYIKTLKERGFYDEIWQAGAILLPIQSVGVMGDERTYEKVVALRAVSSSDGMTAEWSKIPYDILAEISSKIINQVNGINRVVYDVSTKPPATIEWE
jgi:GMP synthase (glutamine-hydrolysing)